MSLRIGDPELFGVTESSLTLSVHRHGEAGAVDVSGARARRRRGAGPCGGAGTRLVRVEGPRPCTEYEIEIEVAGAIAAPDRGFRGAPSR